MENSYGIGVANRYELFYDDDVDPLDILSQTEKKKDKTAEKENKVSDKKQKAAVTVKKNSKSDVLSKSTDKIEPKSKSKTIRTTDTRVKFSDREERNNRRNRPEGDIRENRDNVPVQRENVPQRDNTNRENNANRFDGESRGRGLPSRGAFNRGGRGGRRGSRGGSVPMNGGEYRGKREYDRQSGMVNSGVKAVDKRDGSGAYNWGSDKDQISQEQTNHTNELDTSTENEKPVNKEGVNGDDEAVKEEEQKEMTLDEWKALQKREKPVFKTRRAGEGENTNQWKKTYILKKKVEDESSEEEEEDSDEEEEVQHGRKKVLLPIDFQFSDTPSRGRGRGRGGRGGPGGRGGRGMGRGAGRGGRFQGPHRQEAPKMDDERDFPSLG